MQSFAVILKRDAVPFAVLEGLTLSSMDTTVSAPFAVPFAVKGGGLVFEFGGTGGTIQPKFQVTFDGDAETPSWSDVPNDANTSAPAQFSAALTTGGGQKFEWFGFHLPAAWIQSRQVATNSAMVQNVQFRVSVVGSSADGDIGIGRAFLIASTD